MISLSQRDAVFQTLSIAQRHATRALPWAIIGGWAIIGFHLAIQASGFEMSTGISQRISQYFSSQSQSSEAPVAEYLNLDQAKSPLSKELSKLSRQYPGLIVYQRHLSTNQEMYVFDAKALLRTDRNRPRVNGDIADLLHPLMARARAVYKENNFTMAVSSEVPESYTKPIVKFIKSFYGWNVVVAQSSKQNEFVLKMVVK